MHSGTMYINKFDLTPKCDCIFNKHGKHMFSFKFWIAASKRKSPNVTFQAPFRKMSLNAWVDA